MSGPIAVSLPGSRGRGALAGDTGRPDPFNPDEWRKVMDRHPVREGIIAGIIGAMSVAVWFFIVDLVSGRLFFTPVTLGRALLSVLGPQRDAGIFVPVAAYTLFHYAVFIIIGIVVAYVLRAADTEP